MIQAFSDGYMLSTKSTSYAIFIAENGKAVLAYYGPKIPTPLPSLLAACPSNIGPVAPGSFCSEARIPSEFSLPLRGDYYIPSILLQTEDSSVFDFRFQKGEIRAPQGTSKSSDPSWCHGRIGSYFRLSVPWHHDGTSLSCFRRK
jgi:alpha-galactosidase